MSTVSVFLNSHDSHSYNINAASNIFTFNISHVRLQGIQHGFGVRIGHISFANVVYPINSINNTLQVFETGFGNSTVTLSENLYTGDEFAVELQLQLNTLNLFYTVLYDDQSKKLSIAASNSFMFLAVDNDVYSEMGFIINILSLNQTSTFPVSLAGTQHVDIYTSGINFDNGRSFSDQEHAPAVRVPVGSGFGGYVYYEPSDLRTHEVQQQSFPQSIQFSIFDDKGRPWNFPPNHTFAVELIIYVGEGRRAHVDQRLQPFTNILHN